MKDIIIRENDIINKGLDYIRSLDRFVYISPDQYHSMHELLDRIKHDYNLTEVNLGDGNMNGWTETTFVRKPTAQQLTESMQYSLNNFCKVHKIKIHGWEFLEEPK